MKFLDDGEENAIARYPYISLQFRMYDGQTDTQYMQNVSEIRLKDAKLERYTT